MASARMIRWGLTLNAYDYSILYRPGQSNANADALSRLPLPDCPAQIPVPGDTVYLLNSLDSTVVSANEIRKWTAEDPVLSKVKEMVLNGWPLQLKDEKFRPYLCRKLELSCDGGCVFWGTRIIIPPQGRKQILNQLHATHIGVSRMKTLGRGYVWWPHFDSDVESYVHNCSDCQKVLNKPAAAPLHPWEWPDKPWSRLHIDYAGPFMNRMFLILIDAHSKWLEVHPVSSATSASTIETLREIFSIHGLPEVIVTDNGTCFTSAEFHKFVSYNGIVHVKTAPYHAASNGLAERAVQIFKSGILKVPGGTLNSKIARFLFRYRITPQSVTGVSPAELLMGRKLRSHFDMLYPNVKSRVISNQNKQKQYHDMRAKSRILNVGDSVYAYNFGSGERWLPGVIEQKLGPVSFKITLIRGGTIRRHQDHVRIRHDSQNDQSESDSGNKNISERPMLSDFLIPDQTHERIVPDQVLPSRDETPAVSPDVTAPTSSPLSEPVTASPKTSISGSPSAESVVPLRRSSRVSKPPERLVLTK